MSVLLFPQCVHYDLYCVLTPKANYKKQLPNFPISLNSGLKLLSVPDKATYTVKVKIVPVNYTCKYHQNVNYKCKLQLKSFRKLGNGTWLSSVLGTDYVKINFETCRQCYKQFTIVNYCRTNVM
jgi:hypothetical protein